MKKCFLFAVVLLSAMAVSARPYQHSFGINAGSSNGLSYKGYVRSSEHFIVIADLNVHVLQTKGYLYSVNYEESNNYSGSSKSGRSTKSFDRGAIGYAFEANPNLGYQGDVADLAGASVHWFAGGGISLGFSQMSVIPNGKSAMDAWDRLKDQRDYYYDLDPDDRCAENSPYWMKVGANAIVGMEFCFKNAPLNFGFDFRPGWGSAIKVGSYFVEDTPGATGTYSESVTYFDWGLNASLRYRF